MFDPCQEFVFEGDIIECVQTFKYMGILLKTTSNPDSPMEHLATTNRRSLFALNRRCAELRIMDVKGGSLVGWGPTPFNFSPHNVECKKGER
jgi:hypothetical protein